MKNYKCTIFQSAASVLVGLVLLCSSSYCSEPAVDAKIESLKKKHINVIVDLKYDRYFSSRLEGRCKELINTTNVSMVTTNNLFQSQIGKLRTLAIFELGKRSEPRALELLITQGLFITAPLGRDISPEDCVLVMNRIHPPKNVLSTNETLTVRSVKIENFQTMTVEWRCGPSSGSSLFRSYGGRTIFTQKKASVGLVWFPVSVQDEWIQ